MRLGIFGGSFDPVHNGHLALARACQRAVALDEVWFTPTAIQPLKQHGPLASNNHRVEMLRLAIESTPGEPGGPPPRLTWRVCTLEVDRGGPSYTVDTLRQIHEELPETELFFLIGADAVRDVPKWREPATIFRLATPLVVRRAGEPELDLTTINALCLADNCVQLVEMEPVDVSSTEIRRRAAAGEPIDGSVPDAVAKYIAQNGLYQKD
jgi:nicotinate-nucleotide adenylyltransferase